MPTSWQSQIDSCITPPLSVAHQSWLGRAYLCPCQATLGRLSAQAVSMPQVLAGWRILCKQGRTLHDQLCLHLGEVSLIYFTISRHVVFVDTDAMPAREERLGRLVQNEGEAQLIEQVSCCIHSTITPVVNLSHSSSASVDDYGSVALRNYRGSNRRYNFVSSTNQASRRNAQSIQRNRDTYR